MFLLNLIIILDVMLCDSLVVLILIFYENYLIIFDCE